MHKSNTRTLRVTASLLSKIMRLSEFCFGAILSGPVEKAAGVECLDLDRFKWSHQLHLVYCLYE